MKRKGFTLLELLIAIAISGLVLTMIYATYNTITNGIAKKKSEALGEQFIDEVIQGIIRSYASATSIKRQGGVATPFLLTASGTITKKIVNASDHFQRGFTDISAVWTVDVVPSVGSFNNVLILLLFKFENPLDSSGANDFYRALGISNVDANKIPTKESNFISIEYFPKFAGTASEFKTMVLTAKPPRLYIRKVEIRPDTNDRILNCSIGVRVYLHRAKHIEDAGHFDVYNHGTIRKFTFTIKK